MKNESCSVVSDSLWPMTHTVHGILQARILAWLAVPFSRKSSQPRDQTQVSYIAGRFFTSWATRKAREAGIIIPILWLRLMKLWELKQFFSPQGHRVISGKRPGLKVILSWVFQIEGAVFSHGDGDPRAPLGCSASSTEPGCLLGSSSCRAPSLACIGHLFSQ